LELVPTKILMRRFLLQRFEEQLDLPALAVDGGDGGGGKAAMIGEKHQGALLGLVPDFDATQKTGRSSPVRAAL